MKITGPQSVQNLKSAKKKKSGQDGDGGMFGELMASQESEEPTKTHAPSSIAAMPSLLGLQEVTSEEESRKKLAKRGFSLLDQLDAIRHGLLIGSLTRERIERIRMLLRQQKEQVEDAALLSVIEEIELRAEVELAKLEKFS